jgi:hypothetical protein
MLVMKAWLETRWRFVTAFALPLLVLALNYQNHNSPVTSLRAMFVLLGLALALGSMLLGGSGVKSQAPFGFPEGLVGSTQFTISLPVSRLRLLSVRAGIGLLEMSVVTVIIGCLTWGPLSGGAGERNARRSAKDTLNGDSVPDRTLLRIRLFLDFPRRPFARPGRRSDDDAAVGAFELRSRSGGHFSRLGPGIAPVHAQTAVVPDGGIRNPLRDTVPGGCPDCSDARVLKLC